MTRDNHTRLLSSTLLDGPVSASDIASWPSWARSHLAACPACQAQLDAERQLRRALSSLEASDLRSQRRGPPSTAECRERLARRRPLPAAALVRGGSPLPPVKLRSGASPLELVRTSRGVRAWHPDASQLLVLAGEVGQQPRMLRHLQEDSPGIGLDLAFEPPEGAHVVAVAACQPLEPEHWLAWLQDALAAGELEALIDDNRSAFVHLSRVHLPRPLRASMLRLRADPLPPALPEVAAMLKGAARAGRADNAALAAERYREALELAFSRGDDTGQIKAAAGLTYAFQGLGYQADSEAVMRWLVDTHALDATWASWVCRHLAMDALYRMDLETAMRWAQEAERFVGEQADWQKVVRLSVVSAVGRHAEAVSIARELADADVTAIASLRAQYQGVAAQASLGDAEGASCWLSELDEPAAPPLELVLERALMRAVLVSCAGESVNWQRESEDARHEIAPKDGGVLAAWDSPLLLRLADRARRDGHTTAAAALFRQRFMDTPRASRPDQRLLALASSYDGLLVLSPCRDAKLRQLAMSRRQLRTLIADARDELRGGGTLERCRTLGNLLFYDGQTGDGPIWVGSDGLLAGAPLLAVALSLLPDEAVPPAMRELAGLRQAPAVPSSPPCSTVVSLADAAGDLPWASREVGRGEAALWLRGKEVTRRRLALTDPVGLLHIGLHARREYGMPQLLFADGPMGPVEIASHRFEGAPVVVLAGCATAAASGAAGVERSLADAFLRAGASAVVATHWPVEDREIHDFVRSLVQAWPFDDPAVRVRDCCLALRSRGAPARCWAAPVVY